jgi:hypothetical protein
LIGVQRVDFSPSRGRRFGFCSHIEAALRRIGASLIQSPVGSS